MAVFSHVAICVSDLEKSKRFYCEVFGFEERSWHPIGNELGPMLELEGDLKGGGQFLYNEPFALELLSFVSPEVTGERGPKPMNRIGFTHLSMRVQNLENTAKDIEAFGGLALWNTKMDMMGGAVMFCADPDGTRIELVGLPAEIRLY